MGTTPCSYASDVSLIERFSHEMRTSMTGVMGFSEYIENSPDVAMTKFAAKIINESSKEVSRIASAYCDILHIEAVGFVEMKSTFNVAEVVNDVMVAVRDCANKKNVKAILSCDDNVWSLRIQSDINYFRKLIEALLFDFIYSSVKDDLIQVSVAWLPVESSLQFEVVKKSKIKGSDWAMLTKDFWLNPTFFFQKQEGPGVCGALAKLLANQESCRVLVQSINDKQIQLSMRISVKENQE